MTDTTPLTRRERRAALRAASERVVKPAFRIWAYGVAAAGIGVAVWAGWLPPGALPVIAPLLMAIFYVDEKGEPR